MTEISRRSLLKVGGAALCLGPLARHAVAAPGAGDRRFLVVVNLMGGNDGVNTCVPTHLQPYYERRPSLAIPANEVLPTGGGFGFHPALDGLHALWAGGDVHAVHKVGYPDANLSHFKSSDIYSFGVRTSEHADGRGWLGRFADKYCDDPLGVVAVGVGRRSDFAGSERGAAVVGSSVAAFRIHHDPDYIPDHVLRIKHARRVLEREAEPVGGAARRAFRASREAHELVERVQAGTSGWTDPGLYPDTGLGSHLKAVSQLDSGEFGTKVYYTGLGGFDTHAKQPVRHADLLEQVDGALSAFAADMKQRGRWGDCVVVLISEFGRRNAENGSLGTDHGHGNTFLVIGGGINGGTTGDLTEADLLADQPPMRYDFREVYAHLLERHLGVDAAPVFPEPFATSGDLAIV